MNILIVGYGQIGQSIHKIYLREYNPNISEDYSIYYIDNNQPENSIPKNIDVMHICFPYNKKFISAVKKYVLKYKPILTIIHSTIAPLTTETIAINIDSHVVHSPVEGRHPNLTESILTFKKMVGGREAAVEMACEHFASIGIDTVPTFDSLNTEFGKLFSTTRYGLELAYMQAIHDVCDEYGADFNAVYSKFTEIYNDGYRLMGMSQFVRPVYEYMGKGCGGHCVRQNAKILKKHNILKKFATSVTNMGEPNVI